MEHAAEAGGWLAALQASGLGAALRSSLWLYPLVETLHVLGLALLVGAIATFDVRVLRANAGFDLAGWSRSVLPVARFGFALAVPMGFLLFTTEATAYARNPLFLTKLTLIALALVNLVLFHRHARRRSGLTPALRRMAGLSLALWVLVLACGRLIAYV